MVVCVTPQGGVYDPRSGELLRCWKWALFNASCAVRAASVSGVHFAALAKQPLVSSSLAVELLHLFTS